MICPNCSKDTLIEEECVNCETRMVTCPNCGFRSTLLEYHVWKDIHERRPYKKKTVVHLGGVSEEPLDMGAAFRQIRDLWGNIRIPILIIVFMLMLVLVIIVARR